MKLRPIDSDHFWIEGWLCDVKAIEQEVHRLNGKVDFGKSHSMHLGLSSLRSIARDVKEGKKPNLLFDGVLGRLREAGVPGIPYEVSVGGVQYARRYGGWYRFLADGWHYWVVLDGFGLTRVLHGHAPNGGPFRAVEDAMRQALPRHKEDV